MGCDINAFIEIENADGVWSANSQRVFNVCSGKKTAHPEFNRNYSLFGFLAGVRNYSDCEPISVPKGATKRCKCRGSACVLCPERKCHLMFLLDSRRVFVL